MSEADELKRLLNLKYLEGGESGFISQIGKSALNVCHKWHSFKANSSIYYMLTAKYPINFLHGLAMDDIHIICKGGPVSYYVFNEDGTSDEYIIGSNVSKGELLCLPIPAGSWKALRLHQGAEFALMVSILTPEWTENRVMIGAGQEFIDKYENSSPWATPEFLKKLIGDNFK
ncbi:MAG: cupin domain-containing protein [Bacteroidales bacterium]|nr:cupin domain-containing protein [Bacteroidales bacterium]